MLAVTLGYKPGLPSNVPKEEKPGVKKKELCWMCWLVMECVLAQCWSLLSRYAILNWRIALLFSALKKGPTFLLDNLEIVVAMVIWAYSLEGTTQAFV